MDIPTGFTLTFEDCQLKDFSKPLLSKAFHSLFGFNMVIAHACVLTDVTTILVYGASSSNTVDKESMQQSVLQRCCVI